MSGSMADDPRRDPRLAAALRELDGDPPADAVDWDAFYRILSARAARYARVGQTVAPRLQVTRRMPGGGIHAWLARELVR